MTGKKWPSGSKIEHTGTYVATTKPHDKLTLRRGLTFPKNSQGKPTAWELKDSGFNFFGDLVKHCLPILIAILLWLLFIYLSIEFIELPSPPFW